MKLILYSWNANNEQILADNLSGLGFEVVWFRKECKHYTRDMELAMELLPCFLQLFSDALHDLQYLPNPLLCVGI